MRGTYRSLTARLDALEHRAAIVPASAADGEAARARLTAALARIAERTPARRGDSTAAVVTELVARLRARAAEIRQAGAR